MIGKMYQTKHFITQTVESNGHKINYTTEEATVLGRIFAQTCSLAKGIKNFGYKVLDAALTEVKQSHDRICFRPNDADKLTSKEPIQAMESLIFLM